MTARMDQQKRIISLILSVVLTFLCVLVLKNDNVVEAADNYILLENRQPGYWNYLRPEKMIEVQTIPVLEEVSTEEIAKSNELENLYSGNVSGVQFDVDDDEILATGTPSERIWPSLTQDNFVLESGTYFISLGNITPESNANLNAYLQAWKDGVKTILAWPNSDQYVYVDSSKYDYFNLGLDISPETDINTILHPVVYKISYEDITSSIKTISCWKDIEKNDISDKEWTIFDRSNKADKYFEIFSDNTGFLIDRGIRYGVSLDQFGRIIVENNM